MKSLIINADDAGFSGAINEAAIACYRDGKVTGVSVMACGPAFKDAASGLREIGKRDVGVHLTLTGKVFPCTKDPAKVKRLLTGEGTFVDSYKNFALRSFFKKMDFGQVHLELSNQIRKVLDEGFNVTHLDSHENIHMFPEILDLTVELAREFDVPYIRLSMETPAVMSKGFTIRDLARWISLAGYSRRGKRRLSRANLGFNDAFLGHFHAGRVNYDIFSFMLANLQEGINELAVHPSVPSGDFFRKFPWYRNTGEEFRFLMNEDWRRDLDASGIRLVSHREVCESR